ncbi:MAG: hypothetical protein ACYTEY_05620 [Planctomycetota bacterium]
MAGAVLGIAPVASASVFELQLSDFSSDQTPAGDLSATWEFSVVGDELAITVTNDTVDPSEFNMNQLFWNGPDGVSLTASSLPADWSFSAYPDAIMADGFGKFDFMLRNGQGEGDPSLINPGETLVFMFTIFGGADAKDFATSFSFQENPDGISGIIAAKFVNGPGDDSAFGTTVPAPGVLALIGVAGVIAARPRRRRD